jgi:hypothetical protein
MTLRLGFFVDFKGSDSVLLTGTATDIEHLLLALAKFVESNEHQFSVHSLASVSPRHPAHLFAKREAQELQHSDSAQFSWLCTANALPDIQAKLLTLVNSNKGHQYFDLDESDTRLIVSIGEYSDAWWLSSRRMG